MSNKIRELRRKIGLKIKLERMKRNISQEDLAAMAELSKEGISKIERSVVSPTIDSLAKIADAFNVEFLDLVDTSKLDL